MPGPVLGPCVALLLAAGAAAAQTGVPLRPSQAVPPTASTAPVAPPAAPDPVATASSRCEPWPDEPSPLPVVWSPDPVAASWARARVRELAAEAIAAEARSRRIAIGLWERVLCLDPESIAAADALDRASQVPGPFRPPDLAAARMPADLPGVSSAPSGGGSVAVGPRVRTTAAEAAVPRSGWPFMTEILPPYSPPPGAQDGGGLDFSDVDQEIAEISALNEEAHFRTALAVAGATRELLARAGAGPAVDVRRARLEVLSATAAVALGREDEARAHLRSALAHDPDLVLDAGSTSPKVLSLLREARSVQRTEGAEFQP